MLSLDYFFITGAGVEHPDGDDCDENNAEAAHESKEHRVTRLESLVESDRAVKCLVL